MKIYPDVTQTIAAVKMKESLMKKLLTGLCLLFTAAWLLSAAAFAAENDLPVPENGIPVVLIRIDETKENPTIADMNESPKHKTRCAGTVQIITPEGFTSEYGGTAPQEELPLDYIRGRGNSTWMSSKKPYKIKFSKETGKQDLFGMGKSREWALMANAGDVTLMRNYITSWLGARVGLDYTPQMVPVEVYMEGTDTPREYLGSYCLSELVQVEESRVDIDEPDEEEAEDITGGYLMSFHNGPQKDDDPESTVIRTSAGIELVNEEPYYDDTEGELTAGQVAQREYIAGYIQDLEDLIMTPEEEFTEETHDRIADMMDLESTADYWLIQEFSENGDAYATSSTYLYKEKDGKLYWGPLWDFDMAWFSIEGYESPEKGDYPGFNHAAMIWIDELRQKDPEFIHIIQERWKEMKHALEELSGEKIDAYKELVSASQQADYDKWSQPESEYADVQTADDYDAVVEDLKQYIIDRCAWIDAHMESVGILYYTVTFMAEDETVGTVQVKGGTKVKEISLPEAPSKTGKVFNEWCDREKHIAAGKYFVNEDTVFTADYVEDDDPLLPTDLFFFLQEQWEEVDCSDAWIQDAMIFPENAISRHIRWSISDESIASADESGILKFYKTGDVRITGELYNGVSKSYLIHVYDPEETPPAPLTGVRPACSELNMTVGETEQAVYTFLPDNQPVQASVGSFDSSDEKVVLVTEGGIMNALSPGEATITLTVYSFEDEDWEHPITASFTVTVKEADLSV